MYVLLLMLALTQYDLLLMVFDRFVAFAHAENAFIHKSSSPDIPAWCFYLSPSPQTTTERRPLVPKPSTASSTGSTTATKNGTATTAANKTASSVRTTASTRTVPTTAARKPLGMTEMHTQIIVHT